MNVIEAINIEMRYRGQAEYALKPISFSVGAGEILGLIGQNGSGKSTLMKSVFLRQREVQDPEVYM